MWMFCLPMGIMTINNVMLFALRRGTKAFEVCLLAIHEGLKAIPFGGNPFCASGLKDKEVIPAVGMLDIDGVACRCAGGKRA